MAPKHDVSSAAAPATLLALNKGSLPHSPIMRRYMDHTVLEILPIANVLPVSERSMSQVTGISNKHLVLVDGTPHHIKVS